MAAKNSGNNLAALDALDLKKDEKVLEITQRATNKEVKMDVAHASGGWARIDAVADALPGAGLEVVEVTERPVGRLIAATILARKI